MFFSYVGLFSNYNLATSKPVIQPIERRVVSLTPSLEPIQEFQSQSQSQTRKARFEQSSSSENDEVPSEEAIRDRRKSNSRRRQSGLQNPNVVLNDEPTTNANVNNDIIENENNHQNQSQIFDSLDPLKPDNSIPKRSSTKSRRESTDDKTDINPLKYSNGPRRRSSVNTSPSTTTTAKSKPKVQRASSPKAKTRRSSNQILPTSQTDKVNDENANNNESMNIINENIVNSENLASSTTSSNEEIEGRSSRRSRKSVNYALPSLRTKMRKPDPLDTVPAKPSNGSANELAKALADQNISDM